MKTSSVALAARMPPGTVEPLWQALAVALRDPAAAFRTPVLATVGPEGAPRARTVVLRGVDGPLAKLWLHSDARAGKVADISANPRVALHFYDPGTQIQLRAAGIATLESRAEALDAAWARVPPKSRALYATAELPGTVLVRGAEGAMPGPEDGRANFAVLCVEVARLEWLWLGEPHMRGAFVQQGSDWLSMRLVP